MTAADLDALVAAADAPGHFFCPRCDRPLAGAVSALGEMRCTPCAALVAPDDRDTKAARLLAIAADMAEVLGDPRAEGLRRHADLWRWLHE